MLISVGALITWAVISTAAYFLLRLNMQLSLVLGAILIVSGPTVILPLLRDIGPEGSIGSIPRWERTRLLAHMLQSSGFKIILIDTNPQKFHLG